MDELDKSVEASQSSEQRPVLNSPEVDESTQGAIETEAEAELQRDPTIKGVSIVASHGKRMICILRSFLLDYDKLRLEPLEDCINTFYGSIVGGVGKYIDDNDHLGFLPKKKAWYRKAPWKLVKSPCYVKDFNKTFPVVESGITNLNSERSNMKCFPQFTNGSAINIEIQKVDENKYHLTVSLIPPEVPGAVSEDLKLPKDEDQENKLIFTAPGSEDKYVEYNYKVPFHTLKFEANEDCFLIRNVVEEMNDQYNVIIVRHGQGYHNIETLKNTPKMLWETNFTADTRLTPKGIKDAMIGASSIQKYLQNYFEGTLNGKCKYFSSDLYRAKETAVLIAKHFGNTSVEVTQLPIIHEISNCEKQDAITISSKPDGKFPSDYDNQNNVYTSSSQQISGDITVKIDYTTYYRNVKIYRLLFENQYGGFLANRSSRFAFKDTSFLFQPFEIIELLLAFTCQVMKGTPYFTVNGDKENNSNIGEEKVDGISVDDEGYPIKPNVAFFKEISKLPGFREGLRSKAYKYIHSVFGNTTGGGNRNTLKKRRKRRTNKKRKTNKRRTNKRRTNKRKTNKRKTNKRRTYKRGRTIRQRK